MQPITPEQEEYIKKALLDNFGTKGFEYLDKFTLFRKGTFWVSGQVRKCRETGLCEPQVVFNHEEEKYIDGKKVKVPTMIIVRGEVLKMICKSFSEVYDGTIKENFLIQREIPNFTPQRIGRWNTE